MKLIPQKILLLKFFMVGGLLVIYVGLQGYLLTTCLNENGVLPLLDIPDKELNNSFSRFIFDLDITDLTREKLTIKL